jgi:predicted lipid-binding transport protein (Tim44 family)
MLESNVDAIGMEVCVGKLFMKYMSLLLSAVLLMVSIQADAKRLGGGRSLGQQSGNVSQREAVRPSPAPSSPGQNAAPAPVKPAPAAPPVQQPQRRPWGAMLGGLAAGLGLAWLAHSMGLGAEFGQFLMMGFIALGVMLVLGWFMRRRESAAPENYAYGGAGSAANPNQMPQYNPAKVGNDASARPWESTATAYSPSTVPSRATTRIGSALTGGGQDWNIPEGFDVQGFVSAAKENFISLQAAWDRADIPVLRAMMTDTMLTEIQSQLAERGQLVTGPNTTEVVMLEAQLLGIEDLGEGYMASVEFSGLIREEPTAGPSPFREVWNMTKPKSGHMGWLVAGVQALQ